VALQLGNPAPEPPVAGQHGAGNGILTLAKGTLPLVRFGPQGHGVRQGWLLMPARRMQALVPFLFGVLLDRLQAGALWVTAAWASRPASRGCGCAATIRPLQHRK
jgi:hypothetical protein